MTFNSLFLIVIFRLFGDVANASAAFITDQYAIQKAIGIYFLIMDAFILGQYGWYSMLKSRNFKFGSLKNFKSPTPIVVIQALFLGVAFAAKVANVNTTLPICDAQLEMSLALTITGYVLAWSSGLLYFGSR